MKLSRLSPILLTLNSPAQCPSGNVNHFECQSSLGNTEITLTADTELLWNWQDLDRTRSINIQSAGGQFSSKNIITNGIPVQITAQITADGPFQLFANGIRIEPGASITAPDILIGSLNQAYELAVQETPLSSNSIYFRGNIFNSGTITATNGDLTLLGNTVTNIFKLTANNGKISVISAPSAQISTPELQQTPGTNWNSSGTGTTNTGTISAQHIDIFSESFFNNGGRLEGNSSIAITSPLINHDARPNSLILTPTLILTPDSILEGPVLDPNDGNNPGGISRTLEFPDLQSNSFSSRRTTKLRPTQFSSSILKKSRTPSPIAKKKSQKRKTTVASRGTKKRPVNPKKSAVQKRSFFGKLTTNKRR